LSLWSTLFEDIFLERGKEIIDTSLSQVSINIPLGKVLDAIQREDVLLETAIGNYIWSNHDDEKIEETKKKANGITNNIDAIVQQFDHQLQKIMEDLTNLLAVPDPVILLDSKSNAPSLVVKPYAK
jgi:hypothetical protein